MQPRVRSIRSVLVLGVALGCGSSKGPDAGGAGATAGVGAGGSTSSGAAGRATAGAAGINADGGAGAGGSAVSGAGGSASGGTAGADDVDAASGAEGGAIDAISASDGVTIVSGDVCFGSFSGTVLAGQDAPGTLGAQASLSAGFYAGNQAPDFYYCQKETFGACVAYACPATPPANLYIPGPPPNSGGLVRVSNRALSIEASPNADGTYPRQSIPSPLWAAGDAVTFSVAGDVVPRFAVAVPGTGPLTISAPELPAQGFGMIDRTRDLVFVWTNGDQAFVDLEIDASMPFSGTSYEIRCRFPSAAGTGVVSSAALASVPATTSISIQMSLSSTTRILVGKYCVDLELLQIGQTPNGRVFAGRFHI